MTASRMAIIQRAIRITSLHSAATLISFADPSGHKVSVTVMPGANTGACLRISHGMKTLRPCSSIAVAVPRRA
jgi:hypothetical protein